MVGLKVDWATLTATFPPGNDGLRDQMNRFVLYRPYPQTGQIRGIPAQVVRAAAGAVSRNTHQIRFPSPAARPRPAAGWPGAKEEQLDPRIRRPARRPAGGRARLRFPGDAGAVQGRVSPEQRGLRAAFPCAWRRRSAGCSGDARMLFNTTQFFLFLVVVLVLFYSAPRAWRKYILLAASYFFYASWNPKFIALLLTLTAIDYTAGLWLERVRAGAAAQGGADLSLAANLGFLGFFKYYNFLAANLALAAWRGRRARSSSISCCRSASAFTRSRACPTWWTSIAASSAPCAIRSTTRCSSASSRNWWPARSCARAISSAICWTGSRPSADDVSRGVFLIALGLTKKMAFADQFAKVADDYFSKPRRPPRSARRLERRVRLRHADLFRFLRLHGHGDRHGEAARLSLSRSTSGAPTWRRSITDFWRRWHISLSTWLRDYLYIPLGGNRARPLATYRNLMLTMLLGGLWHGASWNFVIWGGYHGALLAIERALRGERPPADAVGLDLSAPRVADLRPGADRMGILPCRRPAAKRSGAAPDVRRPDDRRRRASAAGALAFRPRGPGLDSRR